MPAIRILADHVANQIAAGEVIERPVAVIKELVENSIDSGATSIEITFHNGGKSYMCVEDNGIGMNSDEALIALERHATSKIIDASDLSHINSFGFRGEALPSIASVSKFTIRTRSTEQYGTQINMNKGVLLSKRDCGMPVGTKIEVSHLFNSLPVRRKFLKTDATESAHIIYTTRLFAVAHPHISFRLLDNARTVFQSPACNNLSDRIAEIWGRQMANDLIAVNYEESNKSLIINGLTAKPGVGRSNRRELVTLVNRRPINSRALGHAVLDAYHGRIQKGRYPPAFLFLTINPEQIDVNVHPAKREIRFRNKDLVRRFVENAICASLKEAELDSGSISSYVKTKEKSRNTGSLVSLQNSNDVVKVPEIRPPEILSISNQKTEHIQAREAILPDQFTTVISEARRSTNTENAISTGETSITKKGDLVVGWQLIKRIQKCYALFESPQGLVMLHIRHAHQRVRYEKILESFCSKNTDSQNLLLPINLEFEPLSSEALRQESELLNNYGFKIEEFGQNFFRLLTIPCWLEIKQTESFIRDLIENFRHRTNSKNSSKVHAEIVAKFAIKDSYRSSDLINENQIINLLNDLMKTKSPLTSPAGKPTISEISWSDWRKRLGEE